MGFPLEAEIDRDVAGIPLPMLIHADPDGGSFNAHVQSSDVDGLTTVNDACVLVPGPEFTVVAVRNVTLTEPPPILSAPCDVDLERDGAVDELDLALFPPQENPGVAAPGDTPCMPSMPE